MKMSVVRQVCVFHLLSRKHFRLDKVPRSCGGHKNVAFWAVRV